MSASIAPIQTAYAGYRFRSRLEARWAVFFDAISLRWEYEPEGFDLGSHGWYLPDFYLPDLGGGTWVEVKPTDDCVPADEGKWLALVEGTGKDLLFACGAPAPQEYQVLSPVDYGHGHWSEVCFNRKYLPPLNHDGKPRLFWVPGSPEDADCIYACIAARSARFEHGETPRWTR